MVTGLLAGLALVWYVVYVYNRIDREYAFIHLVQRIIARDFFGRRLEDELKQIALERDEVELDPFDTAVKHGVILDLPNETSMETMFRRIAETLATRTGMHAADLFQKFMDREEESSTVLKPGFAIPHIVVEGESVFEVVCIRCRPGIRFPGKAAPVTAAFVLAGSRDERNFHRKSLMAIAHIVEEPGFNARWMQARSEEELRDVLLLSRRVRVTQQ